MASIGPKRADGRYRARYRDGNGKEHARHFTRKVDAQRWLDEVTAAVITGNYVDLGAAGPPFGRTRVSGSESRSGGTPRWSSSTTRYGCTSCRSWVTRPWAPFVGATSRGW